MFHNCNYKYLTNDFEFRDEYKGKGPDMIFYLLDVNIIFMSSLLQKNTRTKYLYTHT